MGTLTIFGTLTNNGILNGNVSAGRGSNGGRAGDDFGLDVAGDLVLGAGASLLMPSTQLTVRVEGDYDVAIDNNTHFDMVQAELRMDGLAGAMQALEVMSEDIGPGPTGLDRTLPGHYPLAALRVGPTPTTVDLVDSHDNDGLGQGACEALYVNELIIEPGATLNTNACRIYYQTLTNNGTVDDPANLIEIVGLAGDMNCDGDIDVANDLPLFIDALLDPIAYTPPPGCTIEPADMNGDKAYDGLDIEGFVILVLFP